MWTGEQSEFGEYQGETFAGEMAGSSTGEMSGESPLNEAMEMELASELLGVTSEAELEQFLGGLFKKVGGFFKSGIGKSLGGILKGIAKKALPIVGGGARQHCPWFRNRRRFHSRLSSRQPLWSGA